MTFLCLPLGIEAKTFPDQGTVFEIKEESLLEVIKRRLQEFFKEAKGEEFKLGLQKRAKERILNPFPVKGLHKTRVPRRFYYDPTIEVETDIKDAKGRLIHARGTRVNPLEVVSWGDPLLLIDGSDEEQVLWALKQKGKITCVKGSPIRLMEAYQRRFYFDQGGVISKKFKISQVPARVTQEKKRLLIEEVEVES